MSVPSDGWHELLPQHLKFLRTIWKAESGSALQLDPHLLWWDVTRGRHFTPAGISVKLPILVEAKKGQKVDALDKHGLERRPALRDHLDTVTTGFVKPKNLARLINAAGRLELALAATPSNLEPPSAIVGGPPTTLPLIGVIDDGCAFLNACFLPAAPAVRRTGLPTSRVRWFWDQSNRAPDPGRDPLWDATKFRYGAELTPKGFETAGLAAQLGGESAGYRAIEYLVDAVGELPLHSHGTHVTGLAAGVVDGLAPWCTTTDGGAASRADIAIVKLPPSTITDTSGRSLALHLLNGVRYVLSKATPKQPVVINLSLGHHGGPHDGSDVLSKALRGLVASEWARGRPLVLVTGAGNSYESGTHAHWLADRQGLPAKKTAHWKWDVPAGDGTDSFLNVWSDKSLRLGLSDPDGQQLPTLEPGHASVLWRNGKAIALATNLENSANGAGAHIHIAVAPTQVMDCGAAASPGYWPVSVINKHSTYCRFDAWVDRDDAPFGPLESPRAPSRLLDSNPSAAVVSRERTLNALAEPRITLTAAAAFLGSSNISPYSASGGGRYGNLTRLPLLALPADENEASLGLPGPGTQTGTLQRIGGTSVSSALLTREVVDCLATANTPADWNSMIDSLLDVLLRPPYGSDLRHGAGVAAGRLRRH